ncbi:hypothetical protein KUV85_15605 [Nocardioides panacisoli]|uniref:hypothetical protein n=1 Tax=Nocardioides panacisoli TaxID=627624 RepID=UPI001C62B90C|nr:hypothetical protein [Nocardioides panacisoli]QYJ03732.1 hypothetical protein KUV85_15605 [Nocardioides panacisoli]
MTSALMAAAEGRAAAGDADAAWRLLDAVPSEDRRDASWRRVAGPVLVDLERWDDLAAALPPVELALQLAALGRVQDALTAWRRATSDEVPAGRLRPRRLASATDELVASFDERDEREAGSVVVDLARPALAQHRPDLLWSLTRTCLRTGRRRAAVAAGEDLVRAAPTSRHLVVLAKALQRARRYDESLAVFERASRLDPSSVPLHANRAALLKATYRFDEAILAYEQAVGLSERPDLLTKLGQLLAYVGREDEAMETFARSHALRPTATAVDWMERLSLRRGELDPADLRRQDTPEGIYDQVVDLIDVDASHVARDRLEGWLRQETVS